MAQAQFIDPTDPKWPSGQPVTYSFGAITDPAQQSLITQAFGTWAQATGLSFQPLSSNAGADITFGYANNNATYGTLGETGVSFAAGAITHASVNLQDPGDTELAEANGALSYIRANEAPQDHTTFEQLALHELGHALGFGVDSDPSSIESLFLTQENLGLDQTDLAGASFLYGVPLAASAPVQPPPPPPLPGFLVNGQTVAGAVASSGPSYTREEYVGSGGTVTAQGDNAFVSVSNPSAISLKGGENYVKAVGSSAIDLGTGTAQVSIDAQGAPAWDLIKNLAVGDLVALWAPPSAPGLVPTWDPNSTLDYGPSAITVLGVPEADLQAGYGVIGGENVLLLGRTQ